MQSAEKSDDASYAQALFSVSLGIFKTLFSNAIASLNSSTDGIILQMAMLLGYTVALIFTILRTGAVSKSIFNAH